MPATVNANDLLVRLNELMGHRVLIGIPAANDERDGDGVGNVLLGFVHEFGSPARNIPARPFLIPGVEAAQDEITERMSALAKDVLKGNTGTMEEQLNQIGIVAVNSVTQRMKAGIPPPLLPATVAARRRRSAGSTYRRRAVVAADTTPLIDTGSLLRSITWVVE